MLHLEYIQHVLVNVLNAKHQDKLQHIPNKHVFAVDLKLITMKISP